MYPVLVTSVLPTVLSEPARSRRHQNPIETGGWGLDPEIFNSIHSRLHACCAELSDLVDCSGIWRGDVGMERESLEPELRRDCDSRIVL